MEIWGWRKYVPVLRYALEKKLKSLGCQLIIIKRDLKYYWGDIKGKERAKMNS